MTEKNRRLFFALWPDDQQRRTLLSALEDVLPRLDGRLIPATNWHVTLFFIGLFPAARVPELLARASTIPQTEIELCFDRVDFWKKPRIACLRASVVPVKLRQLVGSLTDLLADFDFVPEAREYNPHLTLARRASERSRLVLAQPLPFQWSGFELVESVSTASGVKYLPVKQGLPAVS